jgi:tRNA modification GTPase
VNGPHTDTIAAIATAAGEAGISIVRISGPDSFAIADRLFRGSPPLPSERPGGSFVHGHVTDANRSRDVDEVVLLVFRAPHSYTCEDLIEIQGHGGRVSAARILSAVLNAGARMAEPGEFTKRAFLNGRIDLLQAEAVADLIRAKSDRAAAVAVEQLEGRLTSLLQVVYDDVISSNSMVEASLDFSDDELTLTHVVADLVRRMERIQIKLRDILVTWYEGHILREGARVVIGGRPNVGKSTLMNKLLGMERSIVTNIPGTTRDTIEESLAIDGVPIRLVDTAGLRTTSCEIEAEGVSRARSIINQADMILYVIDASDGIHQDDASFIHGCDLNKTLFILNKIDRGQVVSAADLKTKHVVACSLLNGRGVNEIRELMATIIGFVGIPPAHAVISERHRVIIQNALDDVTAASELLAGGNEADLVLASSHLRDAASTIGRVIGRTYDQDLLEGIFSRFCIGK